MIKLSGMYTWVCLKICRFLTRIGRIYGGGSALPGLVMEKIHPRFTKLALSDLPKGVVVISGTNGKTSTTKILTEILKDQGLEVFTNPTGSNFLRGITSALIHQVDSHGHLQADIAVLELDEAHAIRFIKQVPPRYSLLLNVMPDQSDRFSELDQVADLLFQIAAATTEIPVLNREDGRLAELAPKLPQASWFGCSSKIRPQYYNPSQTSQPSKLPVVAELTDYKDDQIGFRIRRKKHQAKLKIKGLHNHFNAIGAVAMTEVILKTKFNLQVLEQTLSKIEPAFGRGETIIIGPNKIDLILVKNPLGFQMSLDSTANSEAEIMIAINDNHADGRDVSWLWDVDFNRLPGHIHATTGSRSKDMALRLKYDQKLVEYSDANIALSLRRFIEQPSQHKQIYASYTAMLEIRRRLLKIKERASK